MSDLNTNDNTTMNSAHNSDGAGKAIWDDKAVADMYFTLAEMRGGLHGEEAKHLEERMRAKGYGFTSTQFVNKHNNLRKRLGGDKPAAGAIAEAKTKAKSKASTSRKSRAKIPAVSADGNPVAAKPKAAPKPRGKAAAKKEVESEGNAIEAEEPPTKKRKTSGAKAGKKVIETVADVKDEEAESDSAGSANSAEAMKVDGQSGEGESDTMIMEEYDAPEGEGEQVQMVEATKVEIEEEIAGKTVVETLQAEAQIVIQTSA